MVNKIILFLLLSAAAATGQSQPKISLVQVTGTSNVFTAAQNAGDLNVFLASWNDDTTTITKVTDTAGNTYIQLLHTTTSEGGGLSQDVWYAADIKASAAAKNTLEITTSTGKYMSYLRIHGFEYSGVATSNVVNGTAIGSTGDSADPNPGGAVVTTAPNAMLFCATKTQLGDYVSVQPPGFTEVYSDTTSSVGDVADDALNVPPPPPGWYGCNPTLRTSGAWITQLAGFAGAPASTQNVMINWTSLNQVIDGFGAADAFVGPLSAAQQDFFFGTGTGQLGLSLLRTAVPDDSQVSGVCATVNAGCAGPYVSDMKAMIANGGRIYSTPWTPPPAYKTNGLGSCTNNAGLITTGYAAYATWLANYVESLKEEDGITLYALSLQNEPDLCEWYDSAYWTAAEINSFVANNLGPTFSSDKLPTLLFVPEPSTYKDLSWGTPCADDASCNKYVGGVNWHDYDAHLTGTNVVTAAPYPTSWPAGKKYWETEASCGSDFGPSFCQHGFNIDITDALDWAAVIDQRISVDNANAWLYWWLLGQNSTDDQALMAADGTVAQRAYMLGQYARFVRPGHRRITATHLPEPQVSVSAYEDQPTNALVIIATNYGGSALTQEFTMANAPEFQELTPWITSASLSLAQQSNVVVTSNSFSYTLPAQSITSFVGKATTSAATWALKNSSPLTEYSADNLHSCQAMNVTAGDLLLSYNIAYNGSTTGIALTNSDTQGNTWAMIQTVIIPNVSILQIQYTRAKASGSNTIELRSSASVHNLGNGCEEWSGGTTSGLILDGSAGVNSSANATTASASAATSGSSDLVVGMCVLPSDAGSNFAVGAGAGYTQDVFNNYLQSTSVFRAAVPLGKQTASCTTTGPASVWSAIIAGFLSASGT